MTTPLVTVLMPAYNTARFIGPAIHSVLSQTLSDFELLIINDGSTDDTESEIAQFTDPRVRLLTNPQNLGLRETLNRGIDEARGRYIARLDSDDLCYPNRFLRQIDVLGRDPETGIVAAWTHVIDEEDRTRSFGKWSLTPEAIYYVLHFRNCLTHSSVMFRTRLVRELGGYPDVRTEDYQLWYRMSKISKIVQLPEVLVKWRLRRASITGRTVAKMDDTAFQLAEQHLQELTGETGPSEIVKALIECRTVSKLAPELFGAFPAYLKRIQECILRRAPDFYDKARLRAYIDIETAKYAYIYRGLGTPFDLAVAGRAKLLGFAYYLSRYHCLPLVGALVPKSHF